MIFQTVLFKIVISRDTLLASSSPLMRIIISFYMFRSDLNNSFFEVVSQSRCVLVVLTPHLTSDMNSTFCLNNVITQADVIFAACGLDLRETTGQLAVLNDEVITYMRHKRRPIRWPVEKANNITSVVLNAMIIISLNKVAFLSLYLFGYSLLQNFISLLRYYVAAFS